jgi:hypothetical protein
LPGRTTGEPKVTRRMFPIPGSSELMVLCRTHGWTEATLPDANYNIYCSKCFGGPTQSWLDRQVAAHTDKKPGEDLPGVINLNWPRFTSVDSYQVGRGTVKVVKATERLLDIIAGMRSDPREQSYRHVEIDKESWIIVNIEWQGTPKVGDHICLVVKKPVMGMRANQTLIDQAKFVEVMNKQEEEIDKFEKEEGTHEKSPCSVGCRGFDVFKADFEPPKGWVHIERCDTCNTYPDDLAAARAISPSATYFCVECGAFSEKCCEDRQSPSYKTRGKHRWRAIVPIQDAQHAGLLGKMECEDEEE